MATKANVFGPFGQHLVFTGGRNRLQIERIISRIDARIAVFLGKSPISLMRNPCVEGRVSMEVRTIEQSRNSRVRWLDIWNLHFDARE
jgi:hypothetical protein